MADLPATVHKFLAQHYNKVKKKRLKCKKKERAQRFEKPQKWSARAPARRSKRRASTREFTSRLLLSSAGSFSGLRFDTFFPASSKAIVIATNIIENITIRKSHPKSPCPGHCTLSPVSRNPFAFGTGEGGNAGQRPFGSASRHPRCTRSRDREGIGRCVRDQSASANLSWPETCFYGF